MGLLMSRKQTVLVSKEECRQLRTECQSNNAKVELALFGEDGRGGIVKDIQDIKTKLEAYSSVFRQFGVPVIVAILTAVIVRFLP